MRIQKRYRLEISYRTVMDSASGGFRVCLCPRSVLQLGWVRGQFQNQCCFRSWSRSTDRHTILKIRLEQLIIIIIVIDALTVRNDAVFFAKEVRHALAATGLWKAANGSTVYYPDEPSPIVPLYLLGFVPLDLFLWAHHLTYSSPWLGAPNNKAPGSKLYQIHWATDATFYCY